TNSIDWKEADGSTTTATMQPTPLDFDTNGAFASGSGKATLRLTNGSTDPQVITIDFSQLTQYDSSSTIAGKADGNAAGTLSSIAIDKTGVITGTYTNGEKQVEAQVALQRFNNPGGLTKVGESLYEDSNNAGKSGEPNTAAALGATITPSALEMSNVDVANEFTDMIITQRGFQGNSKIITVSDEMLETLINMKR
ncbi:MAG: flagellar hook-basal body complex protein, partial [Schwartzia sp.]|nr:flagellar hook-basal body complex protein [Schwartzia sp. (in: firmicutes)]